MTNERVLSIPNAINLRELGGYPTSSGRTLAWHKILRSGTLSYLDADGEQALADYGVNTVVDLRSDTEVAMSPDKLLPGTDYHHLSVYPLSGQPSFWDKIRRRPHPQHRNWDLADAYLEMLVDHHALGAYRQMFALMLANTAPDHALVFHCAAGKDRTGIGAMMIEGILGVPERVMRADYQLTNLVLANPEGMTSASVNERLLHGASAVVNEMNAETASGTTFDSVAQFVNDELGGWQKYARQELRLSAHDIQDFVRLYLEK